MASPSSSSGSQRRLSVRFGFFEDFHCLLSVAAGYFFERKKNSNLVFASRWIFDNAIRSDTLRLEFDDASCSAI